MKASLALIASSLAFGVFALALLYAAPVKAEPIGEFLDAVFGARPMQEHCKRNVCVRRSRLRASSRTSGATVGGAARNIGGGRTMIASYYGGGPRRYEPNTHTANGERFNQWAMTAAHRTLPFGARLLVCLRGCATVRVNDRGPAAWTGRSLDLSRGAARAIGLINAGVARVSVTQSGVWR